MEPAISQDFDSDLRLYLLKSLKSLLYNTQFETHMLKLYSNATFQPLLTEKKTTTFIVPGIIPEKKQTDSELEKMTTDALFKVDQILAKAKKAAVLDFDNTKEDIKKQNQSSKEELKFKKSKPDLIKKQVEQTKKQNIAMKSAEITEPTIKEKAIEIERTSIISQKIYEEKYRKQQKLIKELKKSFAKNTEKIAEQRLSLTSKFTSKLNSLISNKTSTFTPPKINLVEIRNALINSSKIQLCEEIIQPNISNILELYKNSQNNGSEKTKNAFSAWLFLKLYQNCGIFDTMQNYKLIKKSGIMEKLSEYGILYKNSKITNSHKIQRNYCSTESIKANILAKNTNFSEIKQKLQKYFLELAKIIQIQISKICKNIVRHFEKIIENIINDEKLLKKLGDLHYILANFRNSKLMIFYKTYK